MRKTDKFQFVEQNKRTPTKSVWVISLLSTYQIYSFTDSRGRLSLQCTFQLPYEKEPFASAFLVTRRGIGRLARNARWSSADLTTI